MDSAPVASAWDRTLTSRSPDRLSSFTVFSDTVSSDLHKLPLISNLGSLIDRVHHQSRLAPAQLCSTDLRPLVKRPHAPPTRKLLKELIRQSSPSLPCGGPIDPSNVSQSASTSTYCSMTSRMRTERTVRHNLTVNGSSSSFPPP